MRVCLLVRKRWSGSKLNASIASNAFHQNQSPLGMKSNITKGESQSCTTQNSFMFDRTCFELTPEAKAGTELNSTNLVNIDWGRIASSPAKCPLIYSLAIRAIHAPDPKETRWEKLLRERARTVLLIS
jgi:hypothetical protein